MSDPKMYVTSPPKVHTVHDLDITFVSGMMLPLTLDYDAGDTFEEKEDRFLITLASKAMTADKTRTLPIETLTIYRKHVILTQQRAREVRELTPEEQIALDKSLDKQPTLFGQVMPHSRPRES